LATIAGLVDAPASHFYLRTGAEMNVTTWFGISNAVVQAGKPVLRQRIDSPL
jgi:hypothetical protein